jgi:TM2 domain-containing membrane protein YozV
MMATREEDRRRAAIMAGACRFNLGDFAGCESIVARSAGPEALSDAAAAGDLGPGGEIGATDRARALGLLGLCALGRGDWPLSHARFREGLDADPAGPHARRLAELSLQAEAGTLLPSKSPTLATALSVVIPGAGQFYAGRKSEGLRHLFFNGLMIYSIASLIRDESYPGAVLLIGVEIPFYVGNVIGARRAATSFNRERRMELVARAVGRGPE